MHWQYTPYTTLVFIAALISGGLTLWGWRRHPAPGAGWFTALTFSAFSWALCYGLEMVSTDLPATLLWSKMQYLGAVSLPVAWLALVLTYTGQRRWLSPRNVALLFVVPLITLALVWTNEYHELIWVNPGLETGLPFNTLSFAPGMWYWVNIAYAYALLVLSTILLVAAFVRSTPLYRRQIAFLLLFSLITWIGNLAYTAGLTPQGMNLTPVTFSVSGLLIAWGLFRYRILDVVPVARDVIVESMSDGVIVLDPQNRVVDINPAAQVLIGHTLPEMVGQPLAQVLADWPALMELCKKQGSAGGIRTEITLNTGEEEQRTFDLRVSPLRDQRGRMTGRLMVWRDVTERKQAEDKLRQLSRAVEQSGSTIVITDLDGNIEFVNPAFTRITGYTFEEAIGENTRILKSGEHPTEFYQELWDTVTRGEVWQGEMINRKKNGEFYWEAATISPVKDQDGQTTHYLAIKEDITARKRIEAALAQEQQKSDALLRNILPSEIAAELKKTGRAAPVLFDCASIMFTDFGDFTTTAEQLSPQELVDDLDCYFSFFDTVIEKYGLEKLKTIGDSYMCAGGLPVPNDTHAPDIVRAALEIVAFTQREKETRQRNGRPYWEIRVGISSGPVVAGIVGQKKYAYDVWGDTVVMASRMESSGEIGRVNISRSTYELVRDQFDCEYRGKVHAKHKGQVEMYFVNGCR